MGWTAQYFTQIIIQGANNGIFIYNGAPGPGTLIGSWASVAGTDPFGNSYPQGLDVSIGTITGSTFTAGNTVIVNSNGIFVYAGTPTGPTSSGQFTAVGSLIQSQTSSITINPQHVGDFIVMHLISNGSAPPSGISGGNCTWQQIGTTFAGSVNSGFIGAVFLGTATATGSATATVSFTGTPTTIRNAGQEYTSTTGTATFVTQAVLDSAGTNTMPALTAAAGNLYSIFEFDNVTTTAGSTTGFTYELDANGNCLIFNPNCTAGTQQPTIGDSTSAFGIAVLLSAGGTPGNLVASIAPAAGTDSFGNSYPQGLNVSTGTINGPSITIGNTTVINNNGISVYNGSAIAANLLVSITPSGGINSKAPVVLGGRTTPAADPNNGVTLYGSTSGSLQTVDGIDQSAYGTQRRTIVSGTQTASSTTFQTFFTTNLAAPSGSSRTYKITGGFYLNPSQAAGQMAMQWTNTGFTPGANTRFATRWKVTGNSSAESLATSTASGTSFNPGFTMATGVQYAIAFEGTITVPAGGSGTFNIQFAQVTSGDAFTLVSGSWMQVNPV